MYLKRTLSLIILLYVCSLSIQAKPIRTLNYELPTKNNWSFVAKNLKKNQILYTHNTNKLMTPASLQKLLVALGSKLVVADTFKFRTSIATNGLVKNNILNGNLYLKFDGDPLLTTQHLSQLLQALNEQKIQRIYGHLIIDASKFNDSDRADRSKEDDYSKCYTAPSSTTNINHNCLNIKVSTQGKINHIASLINSIETNSVKIINKITISPPKNKKACYIRVKIAANNVYELTGCVKKNKNQSIKVIAAPIHQPKLFAEQLMLNLLKQQHINLVGNVIFRKISERTYTLASHHSPNIVDIQKIMLKRSDNLIADTLFRNTAYYLYNRPVNFADGERAVYLLLKNRLGLNIKKDFVVKDGSGLSRENKIDANLLLNILDYIARHNKHLGLIELLPIAGVDGTLKRRSSLVKSPYLVNNIYAKTGSMKDIHNIAGFIYNKRNEPIAFVQMINKLQRSKALIEFEKNIYQQLYFLD